jgi:hypothetical protein
MLDKKVNPVTGSLFLFLGFIQAQFFIIMCIFGCKTWPMKNLILLIFIPLLLSCNKKVKPCIYTAHPAIFSAKFPSVSDYTFEQDSSGSIEKLRLDSIFDTDKIINGNRFYIPIELTIIQSGCHELTQEIRLEFFDKESRMPKNFPAPECANIIAQVFVKLSKIDISAMSFAGLAEAIIEKESNFEYGSSIKLRDGFSVQMDKMRSKESTMVTIILKNSEE